METVAVVATGLVVGPLAVVATAVVGISHRCQQKSCFDHQEHHYDDHWYQSRHRCQQISWTRGGLVAIERYYITVKALPFSS